MDEFSEHAKLRKVQHLSQACGEFMGWLDEQGIHLAEYETVSDVCCHCGHDDSHEAERNGARWFCGAGDCDCAWDYRGSPDRLHPTPRRRDDLLAEHFGIDRKVLEQEKRAMLDAMRRANAVAP